MNKFFVIVVFYHIFNYNDFFICSSAWNEEAPFSIPPHLRDQHSTFEGLQASGGGAKLSGADTPLGDLTIHSAEADNLLS